MMFRIACGLRFLWAISFALAIGSPITAYAQEPSDETRGVRPREYAQSLQNKITEKRPRSRRTRSIPTANYAPVTSDASPVAEGVDVGVTFWQLREAQKTDDPAGIERIAIRKKGTPVETTARMVPTRAKSETLFSDGDLLRLSIEVPFQYYLYLLNREQYADGTMSDPYLVFPASQDIGNSAKVVPNKLSYIPNETDHFEINRLNPEGKNKTAEVFTVLLATQPLEELPPLRGDEEYRRVDPEQFKAWEKKWGGPVWGFEKIGGVGAAITRAEKKAGPSGGETLTQADPEPQTVFHVAGKQGGPLMFTIPVRIGK